MKTLPTKNSPTEDSAQACYCCCDLHTAQMQCLLSGSSPSLLVRWISRTSKIPNIKISFWAHFPFEIYILSFLGKGVHRHLMGQWNSLLSPSYWKATVGQFLKMHPLLVGVPGYIKTNVRRTKLGTLWQCLVNIIIYLFYRSNDEGHSRCSTMAWIFK